MCSVGVWSLLLTVIKNLLHREISASGEKRASSTVSQSGGAALGRCLDAVTSMSTTVVLCTDWREQRVCVQTGCDSTRLLFVRVVQTVSGQR